MKRSLIDWFRHSAPYIRTHRNKTFVISFGGEAVKSPDFHDFIHDIALLHELGIHLILIHGARPQIEACLDDSQNIEECELRITDDKALECVKTAAGAVRVEIEGVLSMGLANSPMAGASINVISGNFVTAKPIGIQQGVDYQHTGQVRRIDTKAIKQCLDMGAIVLIPPLGYSPTGEVFNLNAKEVAMRVATALNADKLLCLLEIDFALPTQLSIQQAHDLIQQNTLSPCLQQYLAMIIKASTKVARIHLLSRHEEGALITELLTLNGTGTLISQTPFGQAKMAKEQDIAGILALINPLVQKGILIARNKQMILTDLNQYQVIKQDKTVIACAALIPYAQQKMAELACLAVHPDYTQQDIGEQLLQSIEKQALEQGIKQLFVLTTVTIHWFRERGFDMARITDLPLKKQKKYNMQRNSRILIKKLS